MSEILAQQIGWGCLAVFCVLVVVWSFKKYRELSAMWELGDELRAVESYTNSNNDEDATAMFINLIRLANDQIEVFDDGNKMEGSIYENPDVVDELKKKLSENSQFKAYFFFNVDNDLLLRRQLGDHERVKIHICAGSSRPDDQTHYKIIDNGLIAHLSKHAFGAGERTFEVLDCRNVLPEMLDKVANLKFGKLRDGVHKRFPDFKLGAVA